MYSKVIQDFGSHDSLRLWDENPKELAAILDVGRQEEKEENKASSLKDALRGKKGGNHGASETNRSVGMSSSGRKLKNC